MSAALAASILLATAGCDSIRDYSVNSYQGVIPMGNFSGWAGAFALAVMMLPIVVRASEEALKLVPQSLRHGSYALGATHWQTVVRVVIPITDETLTLAFAGSAADHDGVVRRLGITGADVQTIGVHRSWADALHQVRDRPAFRELHRVP